MAAVVDAALQQQESKDQRGPGGSTLFLPARAAWTGGHCWAGWRRRACWARTLCHPCRQHPPSARPCSACAATATSGSSCSVAAKVQSRVTDSAQVGGGGPATQKKRIRASTFSRPTAPRAAPDPRIETYPPLLAIKPTLLAVANPPLLAIEQLQVFKAPALLAESPLAAVPLVEVADTQVQHAHGRPPAVLGRVRQVHSTPGDLRAQRASVAQHGRVPALATPLTWPRPSLGRRSPPGSVLSFAQQLEGLGASQAQAQRWGASPRTPGTFPAPQHGPPCVALALLAVRSCCRLRLPFATHCLGSAQSPCAPPGCPGRRPRT